MSDPARNQTDKELARMEKYLASIFAEAEKKLISDAKRFLEKFNKEDSVMKAAVESGELDEDDYNDWRVDRLRRGDELHKIITKVKKEMANCNKTAIAYINGEVPDIFAINYNSIAEVIANSPVNGYTFELIDANTVRNIVTADDVFLPPPQKELDITKDMIWNAKQVNAQLLQGILLGESMDEIADRMANVCNSNASAARRNARTMITAAENSGRQSGMNKAEKDGIVFKKKWIATGDERTRETHIMLNGQLVDNDENFKTINGDEIQFPGDPHAKPGEVYNCRCSLGSVITGFKKKQLEKVIEKQNTVESNASNENPVEAKRELSKEVLEILENNFKNNLSETDYKKLVDILENNQLQAELFNKYGINISDFINDSTHAFYRPSTKSLHWHINTEPDKTTFTTLFHELGHLYDNDMISGTATYSEIEKLKKSGILSDRWFDKVFANIPSSSDEFLNALRMDKDLIREIIDTEDRKRIDPMVKGYTTAIQDFISGVLGMDAKYRGEVRWQHSEKYYNRKYNDWVKRFNSVSELKEKFKDVDMNFKNEKEIKEYVRQFEAASELWAHMNSVNACGGEQLELVKTYCPNSYDAYLRIMEGIQ